MAETVPTACRTRTHEWPTPQWLADQLAAESARSTWTVT
jgi:hypothetical protein